MDVDSDTTSKNAGNEVARSQPVRSTTQRRLWAWAPAAAWAVVIWQLGGEDFSASETSRFLGPFLQWLVPNIEAETLEFAHGLVRKSAHLTEYGILGLLCLGGGVYGARPGTAAPVSRHAALAIALPVLLALADEARQATSGARTGALLDVGLDSLGAVVAVSLGCAWLSRRRNPA